LEGEGGREGEGREGGGGGRAMGHTKKQNLHRGVGKKR